MTTSRPRFLLGRILGIVLLLMGLGVGGSGVWLGMLGGSWYYVAAGVLMLVSGGLILRRHPAALWVYALLLIGTLGWALWESGLDWWPLAARLDVLFVLGVLMLTPWVRGALFTRGTVSRDLRGVQGVQHVQGAPLRSGGGGAALLGVVCVASLAVAVVTWFRDPHDVEGALPALSGEVVQASPAGNAVPADEWHAYGRTAEGQRFSPLAQIAPANVDKLQVAWQFRTGDIRGQKGDPEETTYEVTPLKIGNSLYFCNPHQSVIALDATTGKQLWRYDPKVAGGLALQHLTCRGLSYQPPQAAAPNPAASASPAVATAPAAPASPTAPAAPAPVASQPGPGPTAVPAADAVVAGGTSGSTPGVCAAKLFMPTADGRLIALNPDNGQPCNNFAGGKGEINLWANMPNLNPGSYYSTSPVVVTGNKVIVGGTVLDNLSVKEQSGVIRAFDIDSGKLLWNWDSGDPEETAPVGEGQHYTVNSPNSWSISSVDEQLGMVYVPMGNQPPDQWGANRTPAVEKYSSSVVALDIGTGKVRWVFQTVHHDLWDYDVPSQPGLIDLKINGQTVPALVQPTKQGEIFVLDRRTGTPIVPVNEVPVPQGATQGDHTAATQPKSGLSYEPQKLTGHDMWGATLFDQLACRIQFQQLRYEGRFTPPSTQGSLIYPGNFGVFNWGSVAVDPQRGVAFTTPTYLAFVSKLVPRPDDSALVVNKKPPEGALPALNENFGAPYAAQLHPFVSPIGIPCQEPPWGFVAGADLHNGKIVWKHRNGTVRDLSPLPFPFRMGVPGIGGPLMTAGGVAFYSGALDDYVRGYDVSTGKQLWESRLPAGGQATPMTYKGADDRQYLLVVAGGHGSTGTRAGDSVIAYALPKQ